MKRNDFKKIIKLRSAWKIDGRKGNYELPDGHRLSTYIERLVNEQLELDNLAITKTGDLNYSRSIDKDKLDSDIEIIIPFSDNEIVSFEENEKRIKVLIYEIINNE